VGENVYGIISWNDGLVFNEVQAEMEAEGYEVQPFILPACAVNAPHRRDRVWFIAHSMRGGHGGRSKTSRPNNIEKRKVYQDIRQHGDTIWGEAERCGATTSNTCDTGLQGNKLNRGITDSQSERNEQFARCLSPTWENFPTQSPIRLRDDGFSRILYRYLTKEVLNEISKTSKKNRIKNLPKVWERVQSEEVWEKIRGLYSLESKDVLFQTMQLYSTRKERQSELSSFSKEFSRGLLRILQKYSEFGRTPQGQELEKQREEKYPDTMSFLPHEVALASKAFEKALIRFDNWWRNESIKAYGNAIVPQVAIQIFKAIEQYEKI
jgi:site-specific DNA-cytosine methylase